MDLFQLILNNKEFLKLLYALIIIIICVVIVLKTDRLFKLSNYKGIRYFRNAFFFFGLGFAFRYGLGALIYNKIISSEYTFLSNLIFEFFLIMAGFFLLYSLIWKKVESAGGAEYASSLFNARILIFYLMTIIIVLLDYTWNIFFFMFVSQIILFAIATIMAFVNYRKNGSKHKFLKFYFLAMLLSLATWILNFLLALSLAWNTTILINVYVINIIVFLLFLYGVIKITRVK